MQSIYYLHIILILVQIQSDTSKYHLVSVHLIRIKLISLCVDMSLCFFHLSSFKYRSFESDTHFMYDFFRKYILLRLINIYYVWSAMSEFITNIARIFEVISFVTELFAHRQFALGQLAHGQFTQKKLEKKPNLT